jgi:hypothetical protein
MLKALRHAHGALSLETMDFGDSHRNERSN